MREEAPRSAASSASSTADVMLSLHDLVTLCERAADFLFTVNPSLPVESAAHAAAVGGPVDAHGSTATFVDGGKAARVMTLLEAIVSSQSVTAMLVLTSSCEVPFLRHLAALQLPLTEHRLSSLVLSREWIGDEGSRHAASGTPRDPTFYRGALLFHSSSAANQCAGDGGMHDLRVEASGLSSMSRVLCGPAAALPLGGGSSASMTELLPVLKSARGDGRVTVNGWLRSAVRSGIISMAFRCEVCGGEQRRRDATNAVLGGARAADFFDQFVQCYDHVYRSNDSSRGVGKGVAAAHEALLVETIAAFLMARMNHDEGRPVGVDHRMHLHAQWVHRWALLVSVLGPPLHVVHDTSGGTSTALQRPEGDRRPDDGVHAVVDGLPAVAAEALVNDYGEDGERGGDSTPTDESGTCVLHL